MYTYRRQRPSAGPVDDERKLRTTMVKYVYDFSEGDKSMKDLLGGKAVSYTHLTLPTTPYV